MSDPSWTPPPEHALRPEWDTALAVSPPGEGRARGATVANAMALIAGVVAVLGAPFGLLWAVIAPEVPLRMTEAGPVYADPQPQQVAAADGWFVLLGLPFGVLLAVGVWLAAGRVRGLPALSALVVGAVAAALVAWLLGRQVGLGAYQDALSAAGPGESLARPPDLSAAAAGWWPPRVFGVLLVPALSAAVTYTLLAAWSKYATLRPHEFGGTAGLATPPEVD